MPEDIELTLNPKEYALLQVGLKALAGIESSKLPLEFSADRLAEINALRARLA
jgi:hypothetical protein